MIPLRRAVHMIIVPNLAQLRAAVVVGSSTGLGLVILGPRASEVGNDAVAVGQRILDVGERVGGRVGGLDGGGGKPGPGG